MDSDVRKRTPKTWPEYILPDDPLDLNRKRLKVKREALDPTYSPTDADDPASATPGLIMSVEIKKKASVEIKKKAVSAVTSSSPDQGMEPTPTVSRNDLKLIERLVSSGSDRISYVAGVSGTSSNNPVWRQFCRIRLDGIVCQALKCKQCQTVIRHRSGTAYDASQGRSTGTTGLKRHICPKRPSQAAITAMPCTKIPEGCILSEQHTVAVALSDVCAEDLRPFNFVEGSGFRKAAQTFVNLGARYGKLEMDQILPGRNQVAEETTERANAVRKQLKEELAKQPFIAASTDLWTDEKTSTSYNTVNVSYITEQWELRSRVIGTKPLTERHTGANLYAAMRANLEAAGCWTEHGDNVKYITDNAANNQLAFLERGRGWQSCFCHNLSMVMHDALRDTPEVSPMVDAAKKLARFAKKTIVNSLIKAGDPNGRGLKSAVPTRWNSEFAMLESIIHAHPALTTMAGVAEREDVIGCMEVLEKPDLEAVVNVLAFFNEASRQLSASKHPTGFLVPLMLEHACRHLQPDSADRPVVKRLKANLLSGMLGEKFGGKVGADQYLAMTLHPRYRRLQQLTLVGDKTRSRMQELLKTEAVALYMQRAKDDPTVVAAAAEPAAPTPSTSAATVFSLELEAMSEDEADGPAEPTREGQLEARARAAVDSEYGVYMMDKSGKNVKSGQELLCFWRDSEQRLPTLAALARKVHSTPASSAKAERTFSEAGQVVEKRRARLLSSHVDDLLILRDNRDLLSSQ